MWAGVAHTVAGVVRVDWRVREGYGWGSEPVQADVFVAKLYSFVVSEHERPAAGNDIMQHTQISIW